jgi:YesN/AraC family two-component response regulator
MYNLVIVDDEPEIKNGLCNYFPWNDIGFTIAGQFSNGLEAFQYILEFPVDVVLCDIKMPFMTGIDLARELSEREIKVDIVFLSGYREFDYAQQALIYGVKNYIVKPTKYNELVDVFTRIKRELDLRTKAADSSDSPPVEAPGPEAQGYYEKIIKTVKEYACENCKDASLEAASRLVHLNPFYLSKLFKEKTNQNFSDFLLEVKMQKAKELLGDMQYKTYEISDIVGYKNSNNFTRTFKKYFGHTPSFYRNNGC